MAHYYPNISPSNLSSSNLSPTDILNISSYDIYVNNKFQNIQLIIKNKYKINYSGFVEFVIITENVFVCKYCIVRVKFDIVYLRSNGRNIYVKHIYSCFT